MFKDCQPAFPAIWIVADTDAPPHASTGRIHPQLGGAQPEAQHQGGGDDPVDH